MCPPVNQTQSKQSEIESLEVARRGPASFTEKESAKKQKSDKKVLPTNDPAGPGLEPLTMEMALEDPRSTSPQSILALQRKAGNRAVQRLLAQRSVQAKLTVGPAHDKYEDEADQAAARVMRAAAPTLPNPQLKEDELQRAPVVGDVSRVTRRAETRTPGDGFEADGAVEGQLAARRGSGSPLPDGTRLFMESRFGAAQRRLEPAQRRLEGAQLGGLN